MGWNMSNILVNEAIANKKSGGGSSDLSERVSALETTVGDLETAMTGVYPNVYSTEEVKIGKWGNDDLYRKVYTIAAFPANNTPVNIDSGLTGVAIRKLYGWAQSNNLETQIVLPYNYNASSTDAFSLLYVQDKIRIVVGSDRSSFNGEIILEYIKPSTNTRKRGK